MPTTHSPLHGPTHLLYLHGFRSSPRSMKAEKMRALMHDRYPRVRWCCPQLPPSPQAAMQGVSETIAAWKREPGFGRMAVVGSSLGGYYATWVAEHEGCRAVLLNPAVQPARDLSRYIGEQTSWHDPADTFFFRAEFVDELRSLETGALAHPENYFAIIAKGDEVLNWQEMAGRYAASRTKLLEGGDHALSDFDAHVPDILEFLQLTG